MINFSSFVHYHARLTPDQLAVIYGNQRVTYAGFAARGDRGAEPEVG